MLKGTLENRYSEAAKNFTLFGLSAKQNSKTKATSTKVQSTQSITQSFKSIITNLHCLFYQFASSQLNEQQCRKLLGQPPENNRSKLSQ